MNGLLVGPLVDSAMSSRRERLAACGKAGTAALIRFDVKDGRLTEVAAEGDGVSPDCVRNALTDARAAFIGTCVATLRLPQ